MFSTALSVPGHKLESMERPHIEAPTTEIEVLDGQTTVEELLAELGFEWKAGNTKALHFTEEALDDPFGQPALF